MSGIISDNVGRSSGLVKAVSVSQDYVKLGEVDGATANPSKICFDSIFTSSYQIYKVYLSGIMFVAGTNGYFAMQFTDNGNTPLTGAHYHQASYGVYQYTSGTTSVQDYGSQNQTSLNFGRWSYTELGSTVAAAAAAHTEITIYDPLNAATQHTGATWLTTFWEAAGNYTVQHGGGMIYKNVLTGGCHGMDFYHQQNLAFNRGKIQVYGIKGTL